MGSIWGNALKISVFGESHGRAIGVVLDGFPTGVRYDADFVVREMERRAPGRNKQSTARREADRPCILSGLYEEQTSGAPLCAMIENGDTRSGDYASLLDRPRPGHADYTGRVRFHGANDPRGGGHFSGRLTAPLVFAGALCKLWLRTKGIVVGAHIRSIAHIEDTPFDAVALNPATLERLRDADYPVCDPQACEAMLREIEQARLSQDSVGGVIECAALGLPAGVGSPMLDTVEGRIASLLFGVPAVKGVEFGEGFGFAALRGAQANDAFVLQDGVIRTQTNHNGGINGGITNGMPLVFRVVLKPTPSISQTQHTLCLSSGQVEPLSIHGRHDPCIVTRAAPVIEAVCAVALTDLLLEAQGYA